MWFKRDPLARSIIIITKREYGRDDKNKIKPDVRHTAAGMNWERTGQG